MYITSLCFGYHISDNYAKSILDLLIHTHTSFEAYICFLVMLLTVWPDYTDVVCMNRHELRQLLIAHLNFFLQVQMLPLSDFLDNLSNETGIYQNNKLKILLTLLHLFQSPTRTPVFCERTEPLQQCQMAIPGLHQTDTGLSLHPGASSATPGQKVEGTAGYSPVFKIC